MIKTETKNGFWNNKNAAGISARSIDFSWTWNEKKKNESEVMQREYKNLNFVGNNSKLILLGRNPSNVNNVLSSMLFRKFYNITSTWQAALLDNF